MDSWWCFPGSGDVAGASTGTSTGVASDATSGAAACASPAGSGNDHVSGSRPARGAPSCTGRTRESGARTLAFQIGR